MTDKPKIVVNNTIVMKRNLKFLKPDVCFMEKEIR
jgi:hypothetical protein